MSFAIGPPCLDDEWKGENVEELSKMEIGFLLWENKLNGMIKHYWEFKGEKRIAFIRCTEKSGQGLPRRHLERKKTRNPTSLFYLFHESSTLRPHFRNSFRSPLGHLPHLLPNTIHLFSQNSYLSKAEHWNFQTTKQRLNKLVSHACPLYAVERYQN